MTRITSHGLIAAESCLIYFQHHPDHLARADLCSLVIAVISPNVASIFRIDTSYHMAVVTVNAERISDEVHHGKELRIRQALQDLDILADLFDGLVGRLSARGLCCPAGRQHNEESRRNSAEQFVVVHEIESSRQF